MIEICTDSFDFLVILAQLWAKLPQSAYLAAFSFGFPPDFHNMITAGADEFDIMRDYQNGSAASCCLFQFLRNQPHVLSIKTTGWFIKDQNPALRKDSAGYGQPLLLTAGHGRWVCIPIRIKPELPQQMRLFTTRIRTRPAKKGRMNVTTASFADSFRMANGSATLA